MQKAKKGVGLILTRHIDQSVWLGENYECEIRILGNEGGQVRLAINAPDNILIAREELLMRD